MKVFNFDPSTGKKTFSHNAQRASWTSSSLEHDTAQGYYTEAPEVTLPNVGRKVEITVHVDAGVSCPQTGNPISYINEDQWQIFCLGQWSCGQEEGTWQWVILPSANVLKALRSDKPFPTKEELRAGWEAADERQHSLEYIAGLLQELRRAEDAEAEDDILAELHELTAQYAKK